MGSSPISVEILQLIQTFPQIKLRSVWTNAPRPTGRGQKLNENVVASYIKSLSSKHGTDDGIELRCIEKIDNEEILYLKSQSLDFILVAAYGHILPSTWFNLPRLGSFNIHFSLLPRYRGASPIQAAILNGDDETGVTIQKIQEKLDTGDIILSHPFPLTGLNAPQAFKASIDALKLVLPLFIRQLIEDELTFTPQSDNIEENQKYCRKIKKSDGQIQSSMSITEVYRKFLAYQPWPGIYFYNQDMDKNPAITYLIQNLEMVNPTPLNDIRTQYGEAIFNTLLEDSSRKLLLIKLSHPLRLFLAARKSVLPAPGDHSQIQCLNLLTIQKSGKKVMPVTDFLNGVKWSFPIAL